MRYFRFALLAFALVAGGASAQGITSKPMRLICPFPPGGSADVVARLAAQGLGEALGQAVVVENRAGAGGVVGTDHVAKQEPDGQALILITGAYPVTAAIRKQMPFDPLKDIAMVSMLTSYPFVVSVNPNSRFRTFQDLVKYAKANPGKLNYATAGVGSVHHLSGELFNALAGTDLTHIPFKGGNAPLTETLAGRSDVLFEAMTLSIGQIRAGKLRPLAVTSKERWKALPDVPPANETLPGFEVISFIGLGTTGGTPQPVVQKLNGAVRKMLEVPTIHQRLVELGGEPKASSSEAMREFIAAEIGKWSKVIDQRKIERQ